MTRWAAFAGITLAVLSLLLLLARASQTLVHPPAGGDAHRPDGHEHAAGDPEGAGSDATESDTPNPPRTRPPSTDGSRGEPATPAAATLSPETDPVAGTMALLANVTVSHGLFGALLVGGILYTEVPWAALGVTDAALSTGPLALGVGVVVGVAVALANAVAAGLAEAFGADPSRDLRALLAPDTLAGWVLLLGVVLPVVAGFEELLFRAALVGGFAAGFGVSPWLLAVLSSMAFAAGHGAQGGLGVVVTGLLGLALAATFVLTGSLLVVIVAHYLVNAVEFVVSEGLGWQPFE